jgi:hypothetical protein
MRMRDRVERPLGALLRFVQDGRLARRNIGRPQRADLALPVLR